MLAMKGTCHRKSPTKCNIHNWEGAREWAKQIFGCTRSRTQNAQGGFFSHFLKELLKMMEKRRGRKGGWRQKMVGQDTQVVWWTWRHYEHWITWSSPAITQVY